MIREIATQRMRLRPLREDDREEFVHVHTLSAELFAPWSPVREKTLAELFDEELAKNREPDRHARWTGETQDGRLAGFFNLNNIVRGVFQNAYASWSVRADLGGQGFGTEGVHGLLDLAFSKRGLALHRVQANIIPTNERSVRLARSVGMREEGRALRYLRIDGRWQDHAMYAKTVEEHAFRYLSEGP